MNRLKGFYGSRRSVAMIEEDDEKMKKRKLAVKASRKTYVSIFVIITSA
jgi:hypothetical protein